MTRPDLVRQRYECLHIGVGKFQHQYPECGGTMRRCCDSIVGPVHHRPECSEVQRAKVPEPLRA